MAACGTRRRWLGLALILAAALGWLALPGAFAGARAGAASSARRGVSARAAASRELPFEPTDENKTTPEASRDFPFELTREEKELYYNSGKRGDGVSTVYHFTTLEAAQSIKEEQTFRVSRDTENDADFGPGLYAAPLCGENYTDLQMAQQNFGEVTKEGLAKSECYFRITANVPKVHFSGKEGRLVLLVQPESKGASKIRWSELLAVQGPFCTRRDPVATLIQACAKRLARERARRCRERAEGFAWQVVTNLAALFVASKIFGFVVTFLFIEVPTWLWLRRAEEACVQTFRLPREAAGEAPELGKAARWLFFTWFLRRAALNAAAGYAVSVDTLAANTIVDLLYFVNAWCVAEYTSRGPYNDMVTRLQQVAEEAYVRRLSQPAVLAQLRPGMPLADLERLLGEEQEEAGP